MRLFSLTLLSILIASCLLPAKAQEGADWLSDSKDLPKGVVSNENVGISNDSSPFHLTAVAEKLLKSGKYDKAIEVIQRSLELNQEDLEAHMIYARALERKLDVEHSEDPILFNRCVKEWLSVLRNSYGEEKSETFHGVGIPGINGRFFEDEDRQKPARQHLIKLTGTSPKIWETNERFLQKVARSGETSVRGKVLSNSQKNTAVPSGTTKSSAAPGAQPE